jgi:uncharacterized UPF0160 family protein
VDTQVMQIIDAVDCGALSSGSPTLKDGTVIHGCSISSLVSLQNPSGGSEDDFDRAFDRAANVVGSLLQGAVRSIGTNVLQEDETRALVRAHLAYNPSQVIVFSKYCDWQKVVCQEDTTGKLLYAVFQSPDKTWMVQQVPKGDNSFEGRKSLPSAWAGLRDGEFAEKTGVQDAVFCHRGRFICGAKSLEGAMRLAQQAAAAPIE